jgi:hypothetical protein
MLMVLMDVVTLVIFSAETVPGPLFTCFTGTKVLHASYTPRNAGHLLRPNRPRSSLPRLLHTLTRLLHASHTPLTRLVTLVIFSAQTVPGPLFTCFTGTKVQILTLSAEAVPGPLFHASYTPLHASYTPLTRLLHASCTPRNAGHLLRRNRPRYSLYLIFWYSGTHFTCFTGTKVQILTLSAETVAEKVDCFGSQPPVYLLYLLYWYRSTNTDALRGNCGR